MHKNLDSHSHFIRIYMACSQNATIAVMVAVAIPPLDLHYTARSPRAIATVADLGGNPPLAASKSNLCLLYRTFGFVPIIISLQRWTSHLELQNSGQTCVMNAFT